LFPGKSIICATKTCPAGFENIILLGVIALGKIKNSQSCPL